MALRPATIRKPYGVTKAVGFLSLTRVSAAPLKPVLYPSEVAAAAQAPRQRRVLPRPDCGERGG